MGSSVTDPGERCSAVGSSTRDYRRDISRNWIHTEAIHWPGGSGSRQKGYGRSTRHPGPKLVQNRHAERGCGTERFRFYFLFCFIFEVMPCGPVPISARLENGMVLRMRNELNTMRCIDESPQVASPCLYCRPPSKPPSFTSFPHTSRQRRTAAECKVVSGGPHPLIFHHSRGGRPPPFSLLLLLFFASQPWLSAQTSTQPSERPSLASPSLHCTSQVTDRAFSPCADGPCALM